MPGLPSGKQLEDLSIPTAKLANGILSADAAGRAKFAASVFDLATLNSLVVAGAITLAKLEEAVLQADGGQVWTGDQDAGGQELTNLKEPTATSSAATRGYVDARAAGLDPKASCRAGTTQDLSLEGTGFSYVNTGGVSARGQFTWTAGPTTLDTIALIDGDRILVKNQTNQDENGIWVRTSANTWDRATDYDEDAEVTAGSFTTVSEGATQGDRGYLMTSDDPVTIGGAGGSPIIWQSWGELQLGGPPTSIAPDDSATEGTSSKGARSDHKHGITTVSPTVTTKSEATAAAEGVATTFLRSDAQTQTATAAPVGTSVQSDAGSPAQGAGSAMLRSDASLTAATAAPVDVGIANAQGASTSLARANHVHRSPKPTSTDKELAPATTSGDASTTALTISATPALGGYVGIVLNKFFAYKLANGDGERAASDCYFSGDGGTTAKAHAAIVAGDTLFWNGVVTGFDLVVATDRLSFIYETF